MSRDHVPIGIRDKYSSLDNVQEDAMYHQVLAYVANPPEKPKRSWYEDSVEARQKYWDTCKNFSCTSIFPQHECVELDAEALYLDILARMQDERMAISTVRRAIELGEPGVWPGVEFWKGKEEETR